MNLQVKPLKTWLSPECLAGKETIEREMKRKTSQELKPSTWKGTSYRADPAWSTTPPNCLQNPKFQSIKLAVFLPWDKKLTSHWVAEMEFDQCKPVPIRWPALIVNFNQD